MQMKLNSLEILVDFDRLWFPMGLISQKCPIWPRIVMKLRKSLLIREVTLFECLFWLILSVFSNLWFAMMYTSRENNIRNQIWLLSIFWVSLFDPNAKIVDSFLPPVTVKSVPVNRGLRGIDGLRGTAGLLGNRGLLVAVELDARFSADARSALRASRRFSIADFLELRRITPARCCCAAE